MTAGALLPLALLTLMPSLPISPALQAQWLAAWLPVAGALSFTSCGALLIWLSWLTPWLDAGNRRLRFKHAPADWWKAARLSIWTPSALISVTGFSVGLALPVHDWLHTGNWLWGALERWAMAGLALAGAASVWSYWLQRATKRRLLATLGRRQLCFTCGYDLRGSMKVKGCPECGTPTPLTDEQTSSDARSFEVADSHTP